jgi:histidinol-phosphate/aromatic aminotransferase/cobyric acid decarboxylase-like protein
MLFAMIHLVPGDAASIALGPRATPEMVAEFRTRMGLDRPLAVQFAMFFANAARGDFGRDVFTNEPVLALVFRQLPYSFALAGAGLGYLAAAPEICDALRVVRLPYHLSAVTQATASAALRHADALLANVEMLRQERDRTVDWLRGRGYDVAESDANFVLFGRFADRHGVWQSLLDQGVLIRETGPEGWLRVSIGTADEMAAFTQALDNVSDAQENGRVAT